MMSMSMLRCSSVLIVLALLGACSCSSSKSGGNAQQAAQAALERGEALVVGTVVDAKSGAGLGGAHLSGPGGIQAESAPNGYFELARVAAGTQGELTATLADGRRGSVWLRSLKPGRLEVVIHVRKP